MSTFCAARTRSGNCLESGKRGRRYTPGLLAPEAGSSPEPVVEVPCGGFAILPVVCEAGTCPSPPCPSFVSRSRSIIETGSLNRNSMASAPSRTSRGITATWFHEEDTPSSIGRCSKSNSPTPFAASPQSSTAKFVVWTMTAEATSTSCCSVESGPSSSPSTSSN